MLLHVPACITAELTLKLFAQVDEWEGFAQYRSVGGGIGVGIGIAAMFRWASHFLRDGEFGVPALEWTKRTVTYRGNVGKVVSFLAFGWTMIKWYGLFSGGNDYIHGIINVILCQCSFAGIHRRYGISFFPLRIVGTDLKKSKYPPRDSSGRPGHSSPSLLDSEAGYVQETPTTAAIQRVHSPEERCGGYIC